MLHLETSHKIKFSIVLILLSLTCHSQELFSYTEPASNRAAGSIGLRLDNSLMDEIGTSKINYHLIPELMVGVSKKITVAGSFFISNRTDRFKKEGGCLYAKYRFLSHDGLQKHFRMAAYLRLSFNNSDIHQEEIETYGHNTGIEIGMVATKLIRKVAISTGFSFVKATDNGNGNKFIYGKANSHAVNYTLSIGKLMLPKEYMSYKQTNINCMVEFMNQVNTGSGKYYTDVAPVIQMIFNSQSRIDIGYRKELSSNMVRTAPNGFFVRLEHNFFNVF